MPKYIYRCSECGGEFEVRHSMTEVVGACVLCGSGPVSRVPSLSFSVSKSTNAGSLVKEYIKDVKRDIQDEKRKLKEDYNG
mgnify:CR=1 FL=1